MLAQEDMDFGSWDEFVTHVRTLFDDADQTFRTKYWFRGQSSSERSLTPSFDRIYLPRKGVKKQTVYDELIREFIKHSEENDLLAKLTHEAED